MAKLCHPRLLFPYKACQAAKIVSGDDLTHPNSAARQSEYALIKYSYLTIRRIYNHWLDFGDQKCEHKGHRKKNKKIVWSRAAIDLLKNTINENLVLYLDEISKILFQKLNIKFSISSISKTIRHDLKYSRKVVYEKANQ